LKNIDAGRGECDVPAWRRGEGWRAGRGGGSDPAVMLKNDVVGREVVLVGNNSGAELEGLRGGESVGSGDQVSGEAAGEEVAGGAGWEKEQGGEG